ncbi:MAG: hypothetical protein H6831_16625 [Planctomycetes bacterium]|nr:hypothetical protein [Planctomycetota bacterium]
MNEESRNEGRESRRLTSCIGVAIGIAVALLALVSLLAFLLLTSRGTSAVAGAQPGGRITGHVTPLAAAHDVREAQLFGGEVAEQGALSLSPIATVPLAPDGTFAFDAPPIDGVYLVEAGGGLWRATSRDVSLLDEDGTSLASVAVDLELERGCELVVKVRRLREGAPLSGQLEYDVRHSGGLFGLFAGSRGGISSIHDGEGRVGGLPPCEGEVTVTMEDGASQTFQFELESGRLELGIDL